jgi:hypothetical protein
MTVVHVGLGKTGTTTLKRYVYSKLAELRDLKFNSPATIALLKKHSFFGLPEDEKAYLKKLLDIESSRQLICLETLVTWDPHGWTESADRNLEIFGESATIIITIREPISYLTSIYQQIVHEGNVKDPQSFFVDSTTYARLSNYISYSSSRLEFFDVDSFDLELLTSLYRQRFANVFVVTMSDLRKLKYLETIYDLSSAELSILTNAFQRAPHTNRAYSQLGMNLTFTRESMLMKIGAKSLGSDDKCPRLLMQELDKLISRNSAVSPVQDNSTKLKLNKFIRKKFRRIKKSLPTLRWRSLIQKGLDRIIPYHRYQLPKDIYLNDCLTNKNISYIKNVERAETNFLQRST